MYRTNLQSLIMTSIRQCKQLLENHYREYQIFHNSGPCDDGGSMEDYDEELRFKIQEADLACICMHHWFDDDGSFKDKTIQYEVTMLFAYCFSYAKKHNPILQQTLKGVIRDMEKVQPGCEKMANDESMTVADVSERGAAISNLKH